MLDGAVDAEQAGVVAADPQHERLAARRDLEVAVRDPAAERLDRVDAVRPHARNDGIDHERISFSGGIEQRLRRDLAGDPLAEDLHLDRLADVAALSRQVRVRDRAADGVAVAAARHAADQLAVDAHRLGAERDRARIGERQAAQHPLRLLAREQRLAADEVALVELHREAEPRLVRRVLGRDVRAPHAVALLEPQRVDRLVPAGDEPVLPARLPDRVPERRPNSVGQ